jgi:RHS repeat-associated protein
MPEINFFWDPLSDNILQERNETGAVTAEYTTEPGLYGNVISQNRGGAESQFHYDAQGSTLAVTNDNQQVTDTRAYAAFGETTESTGETKFSVQFIGRLGYHLNSELQPYYVRRRGYDAAKSRWLSVDVLDLLANSHSYLYVANQPLIKVDPSGLREVHPVGVGVICVLGQSGFFVFCPKMLAICVCDAWSYWNQLIGTAWLATLPNCPCNIGMPPANPGADQWEDPEPADSLHHPGAVHCIRSKPTSQGHAQQCCFDRRGALITEGSGAGTPDYGAFPSDIPAHLVTDVSPFHACCTIGRMEHYLEWRPPNNGNGCPSNEVDRPLRCARHKSLPYGY